MNIRYDVSFFEYLTDIMRTARVENKKREDFFAPQKQEFFAPRGFVFCWKPGFFNYPQPFIFQFLTASSYVNQKLVNANYYDSERTKIICWARKYKSKANS